VLENTGIATKEMFEQLLPSAERRKKGPYVVIECYEEIPCNPCVTSCPAHAVSMKGINDLPQCNHAACTGCTLCVSICPGLACFVIDETVGNGKIKIMFPYESAPLPKAGDDVDALGRDGSVVGKAEVVRVNSGKKLDRTNVITILVDDNLIYDVRSIAVR
jgi:Fe-S-cluster-containing hydrogenase component 2